jgi:hypothetical protein
VVNGSSSSGSTSGGTSSGSTSGGTSSGSTSGGASGNPGAGFGAGEFNPYEVVFSSCPIDQTMIDGECKDDYVDSNALPEYEEALVGRGDDLGVCFDASKCFANAVPVSTGLASDGGQTGQKDSTASERDASTSAAPAVDAGVQGKDFFPLGVSLDLDACAVNLNGADATRLNLALVTPDTGECLRPNECYVPIDKGAGGWREEDGRVQLPKFVCKLLNDKHLRLFASEGTCTAKTESNPVCVEPKSDHPTASIDAGSSMESGTLSGGPQLVVLEPFATTVRVTGGELFFAGAGRLGHWSIPSRQPAMAIPLPNQQGGGKQPWVINSSGDGTFVLTSAMSATGYVFHGPDGNVQPFDVGMTPLNGGVSTAYGFAWAVGGAQGGVYQSVDRASATPFDQASGLDVTAVGGGGAGFVFGTGTGMARACSFGTSNCGQSIDVGSRIDDFTFDPRPGMNEYGYALAQNSIARARVFTGTGQASIFAMIDTRTLGISDGGQHYRRGIASAVEVPGCIVFTSQVGVEWVTPDLNNGGVLVKQPETQPALGVAIGPGDMASGGAPMAYYAVFSGDASGGIWSVPLPPECRSGMNQGTDGGTTMPDSGTGEKDASVPPPDDAGTPPPPDAGDPGGGDAAAGGMDGGACAPPGITCDMNEQCCSMACVNFVCK